jgi:3-oxoadipate enol-lactonase
MCAARSPAAGSTSRGKIDVAGGRLAYETSGQGPPLLFVHSVIADQRMWDREMRVHSAHRRTIRFDLRGFGGSSPATAPYSNNEDIEAVLSHAGVSRTFLVGSSMGGALAVNFALEHPERVTGLLLAAPGLSGGVAPPYDPEEQEAFEYDEKKSQDITQAWSAGNAEKAYDLLRQLWCSALTGEAEPLFRRMVEENRSEVFEDRSMRLAQSPPAAEGRLPSLQVPTTVMIGDRDNPSSVPFARRIARAVPGARLITVPGADHLINLSRPEAFDRALAAALAATEQR